MSVKSSCLSAWGLTAMLWHGCTASPDASSRPSQGSQPLASAGQTSAPSVAAPAAQAVNTADTQPTAKLDGSTVCAGICGRSTELRCAHANDCERLCADSMREMPCQSHMATATACMLGRPASDWECSEDGLAAIKDGFCKPQQDAFANCLAKELNGTL